MIKELYVSQISRLGQGLDSLFLRTFAEEQKKHIWILAFQLGSGIEEGFEAVCVAYGSDVADEEFFFSVQLLAKFAGCVGRSGGEDIRLRAISIVLVMLCHLVKWKHVSLGLLEEYGARTLRLTKASSLIFAVGPARL